MKKWVLTLTTSFALFVTLAVMLFAQGDTDDTNDHVTSIDLQQAVAANLLPQGATFPAGTRFRVFLVPIKDEPEAPDVESPKWEPEKYLDKYVEEDKLPSGVLTSFWKTADDEQKQKYLSYIETDVIGGGYKFEDDKLPAAIRPWWQSGISPEKRKQFLSAVRFHSNKGVLHVDPNALSPEYQGYWTDLTTEQQEAVNSAIAVVPFKPVNRVVDKNDAPLTADERQNLEHLARATKTDARLVYRDIKAYEYPGLYPADTEKINVGGVMKPIQVTTPTPDGFIFAPQNKQQREQWNRLNVDEQRSAAKRLLQGLDPSLLHTTVDPGGTGRYFTPTGSSGGGGSVVSTPNRRRYAAVGGNTRALQDANTSLGQIIKRLSPKTYKRLDKDEAANEVNTAEKRAAYRADYINALLGM